MAVTSVTPVTTVLKPTGGFKTDFCVGFNTMVTVVTGVTGLLKFCS
jgi:hypothetical protein